jgi:hypothetical protein
MTFDEWWKKPFDVWRPKGLPTSEDCAYAAWQASRAALLEEIKANGPLIWYEAEPLYRLPEGEV